MIKRLLYAFMLVALGWPAAAQNHIWLEGEAPTSVSKLKQVGGVEKVKGGKGYGFEAWGNADIMSGGKLLHVNMNSGQAAKYLPDDGLVVSYDFTVKQAGKHAVWARIGYEWVRSNFQWRVDDGAWTTSDSNVPTVNIQPIQTWNELAWLKLGEQKLSAGKHRIEFKHYKYDVNRRGKKSTSRILHMLDCMCITPAEFRPAGKWQPGQDHRSAKDKQAEQNAFKINAKAGPDGRAWTELDGLWTTAVWDEQPVNEAARVGPVKELPALEELRWFAYRAPGDRDAQHPEMGFSHRYLVRARLDVPAAARGKGFFLDVQRSNLIASVFVNGKYAGWTKTFHTGWQLDLSQAIEPGTVNDLVIVFKDAYYSLNPARDAQALARGGNRAYWNLPRGFLHDNQGTAARHDFPVAADVRTGILETASLVVCGPVYAADVFAKPSVKNKKLGLEVTVHNPTGEAVNAEITNTVVPWNKGQGGKAECSFPRKQITLAAGETKTINLSQAWAQPRLWWPDDPFLYWVVTEVDVDGKVVDMKKTRFGFREWDWSTHMFVLNGVKWPMWADLSCNGRPPQEQVKTAKTSHQNQMRYWHRGGLGKLTRREALNYFDEHGMIVRSSGTFDGQRANYGGGLREPDPNGKPDKRGRRPLRAKQHFFKNWDDQMAAWVKEERNHPSIYIWSLENEIVYINVNNLGQWREVEPAISASAKKVLQLDPTRPVMVDGGNCLRDESLPVNGAHYTEFMNGAFRDMPDLAYSRKQYYDKDRPQRGAWRMVPNRPIMKGEVYFANGYATDRFATIGGDRCFIGRGETREARGFFAKMLSEGYRWAEVASFHFWMGGEADHMYWNSWSPVAVFCRQWNWTFGEQTEISRTLKVFNSTRHPDPIEVTWELKVDGKRLAGETKIFDVAPGEAEQFGIRFTTPAVTKRTGGELVLVAKRKGKEVFRDTKPLTVIAPNRIATPSLKQGALAVYDPKGTVKDHLRKRGISFVEIAEYGTAPTAAAVIILGGDAVPDGKSTDTYWYSLAAAGKKVVVLDQKHPLYYQAIPADLKPTKYTGRFGFSEDLSHPVFKGMDQSDFFCWGNDHVMYRNAYRKGTRGGRSLLQCDNSLSCSALFESQVGDGLLILSQLAISDKLGELGVAQQVFNNLLSYAAAFKPVRKETHAAVEAGGLKAKLLDSIHVKHNKAASPLAALKPGQVAVVDATPANLKVLAQNRAKVESFCRSGGWLMIWGLTPEGLADFNKVVGHNHVIREFQQERVLLSYPQDPLASGLTLRDVVMDTGQKMYGWMALKRPDRDGFKYIVDHTDIAPFCKFPTPVELGKPSNENPGVDHWPRNMVNGFTSDDNWAFTYTIIMDRGDKRRFTLELPKEEELVALKIRPSRLYHPITEIKIYFDADPKPVVAEIPVRDNPITEDIPVKGRKAKKITLEISDWQKSGKKNIVVIDNLWLRVKRSEDYVKNVKSLLNIGALMRYSIGDGGIVLNQINLVENEKNPANRTRKATITKTLLKNMGATFNGGSKTVVAGAGLDYEPVKIPDGKFNAYVHNKGKPGWFKGPGTMSALPVGRQTYSNVEYSLSDFSTSPVPSVFMLKNRRNQVKETEIKDIKIGRKADALFFLHTLQPEGGYDRNYSRWARRKRGPAPNPPVAFKYVVHYDDGKTVDIPVVYQRHIGPWATPLPRPLPEAGLAWVGDFENPRRGEKAAVYSMQWDNPRHKNTITSIDIVSVNGGKNGAPAVFAITTATVIK